MSPSVASRARLASIMPAPVAWRSAWTSLAVKDIVLRTPAISVVGAAVVRRAAFSTASASAVASATSCSTASLDVRSASASARLGLVAGAAAAASLRPLGSCARRRHRRRRALGGEAGVALGLGGGGLAAGVGLLGGDARPPPRRCAVAAAGAATAGLRRLAMKRPSSTASAMIRHISVPARMASSLPGMTYCTTSGSQLVSTTATTGMPSLLASVTAMCSFLVSMHEDGVGPAGSCCGCRRGCAPASRARGRG